MQRKKILMIDDDLSFCRRTSEYLNGVGFDVTQVHSGKCAIKEASANVWDAVLVDVVLPDIDGFEVVRLIREWGDNTPVLIITAIRSEQSKIVGLEVGADDYVAKATSPRELLARINAITRRVGTSGQSN